MVTLFYEVQVELAALQEEQDEQFKQYRLKERRITGILFL